MPLALLLSLVLQVAQPPAPAVPLPQTGRGAPPPPIPLVIGPSAPVPPEVAIPRPTAAEAAQANAALETMINAAKPETKALLQRMKPLITVQQQRLNLAATYTQTNQRRGARHEGFVQRAQQGGIDLLLHGDSITDWWLQEENRPMFDKYFGGMKTANFAIAGDTTQGVLWGLHNGEGQGYQAKAVMLMIGTNNASNTAMEVAEGIGAIVYELRHDFPEAKILLLGIFPRSIPGDPVREKNAEVNRIIAKLDDQKHVYFMDIGSKFLDDKGFFLPDTFRPDLLHPIAGGYDIWGAAVKAKVAELMR